MPTQKLYNPNDSVTGRDGGPYLDEEEARQAEFRRAQVEDREPDYDNPPAIAGVPLVPASDLVSTATVNNLPSQAHNVDLSLSDALETQDEQDEVSRFTITGERDLPDEEEVEEHEGVNVTADGVPADPNVTTPADLEPDEDEDFDGSEYEDAEDEQDDPSDDFNFDTNK